MINTVEVPGEVVLSINARKPFGDQV